MSGPEIRRAAQVVTAMRGSFRATENKRTRTHFTQGSGDMHADPYTRRMSRELARDLHRNSGPFFAMLNRWTRLVVGSGVQVRPTTSNPEWNRRAAEAFDRRAKSTRSGLDARGIRSWYALQRLFAQQLCIDGDMGVLKLADGTVQLIEAEQIDGGEPVMVPGATQVFNGVAMNDAGRALAYFVRDYANRGEAHPIAPELMPFQALTGRYSQTRGLPLLVSCLDDFEMSDSYVESEVIAAEQGAQVYGAIEFPLGQDPYGALDETDRTGANPGHIRGGVNGAGEVDWQPTTAGSLMMLGNGQKYVPINPQRPNRDAEPFSIFLLRGYSSVLGLPYEIVYDDLRGLSWSTSRALISSARQTLHVWQTELLAPVFSDVYRWTIARMIEAGELPRISDWDKHEHEWPELEWPDPLKETQQAAAAIALGKTSLHRVCGQSWEAILNEQAQEAAHRDALFVRRVVAAENAIAKAREEVPGLSLTWQQVVAAVATTTPQTVGAYLTAPPSAPGAPALDDEQPPAAKDASDEE
jgi:capsid protein